MEGGYFAVPARVLPQLTHLTPRPPPPTAQENLRGLQQALQLHTTQHEAQVRETRAALETLAEAEGEMESVHFEKKQLLAQWQSSLLAVQK